MLFVNQMEPTIFFLQPRHWDRIEHLCWIYFKSAGNRRRHYPCPCTGSLPEFPYSYCHGDLPSHPLFHGFYRKHCASPHGSILPWDWADNVFSDWGTDWSATGSTVFKPCPWGLDYSMFSHCDWVCGNSDSYNGFLRVGFTFSLKRVRSSR